MAINTRPANRRGIVPLGSIVALYDFGSGGPGGVPLTFDSKTWAYCVGQTITDVDSPLFGRTLPDLSGRCLVGYGTEKAAATLDTDGNQDIDDPFTHDLTGNPGSTFNLYHRHEHNHYHTLNDHQHWMYHRHTLGSSSAHRHTIGHTHTFTMPKHRHKWMDIGDFHGSYVGGLVVVSYNSSTYYFNRWYNSSGYKVPQKGGNCNFDYYTDMDGVGYSSGDYTITTPGASTPYTGSVREGSTYRDADTGTNNDPTSGLTPNYGYLNMYTDYSMSSSTDLRPRSVRVRFIMRIA